MDKQAPLSLGHPWRDDEPFLAGPIGPTKVKSTIKVAPDLGQDLDRDQSIFGMAEQLKSSIRDDRKYRLNKAQ